MQLLCTTQSVYQRTIPMTRHRRNYRRLQITLYAKTNVLLLPKPYSASYPPWDGKSLPMPKGDGALKWRSEGRHSLFHLWMHMLVAGKTV